MLRGRNLDEQKCHVVLAVSNDLQTWVVRMLLNSHVDVAFNIHCYVHAQMCESVEQYAFCKNANLDCMGFQLAEEYHLTEGLTKPIWSSSFS